MSEDNMCTAYRSMVLTVMMGLLFLSPALAPALPGVITPDSAPSGHDLPPPLDLPLPLEESICRRMSVREFTGEDLSEEELATLCWAAYGATDGRRTVADLAASYGVVLYVLTPEGVFVYDSLNHSLIPFRRGDHRWMGQYDTAAVKFALVWDRHACSDENVASAVIGEMGQNVYFAANALGLGTVTTASEVSQLRLLGLPSHQVPKIIMPIGPPAQPYHFTYQPLEGPLPPIQNSTMSLSAALKQRQDGLAWQGNLTAEEQAHLVWAAYGYSYYLDAQGKRHRTVPSSHGTYPLRLFAVNASGIYEYLPARHALVECRAGDQRPAVGEATRRFVAEAPLIIIPVLNTSRVDPRFLWPWYYEGGAAAHTVLLEATALNLSAAVVSAINNSALQQVLGLRDSYRPLLVVPAGRKRPVTDTTPPTVNLLQPREGFLFVLGREVMPLPGPLAVIIGPLTAQATASDDYGLQAVHWQVDGRMVGLGQQPPYRVCLPPSLSLGAKVLTVTAVDYGDNVARASVRYVKAG